MANRTARIELRADPQRERRIRYAAELSHKTVTAFVLDAAAEQAERIIGETSVTIVPADFFDQLWGALDCAPAGSRRRPRPSASLKRAAKRARRVTQRGS
jgi:uncharacterized protein (DUF1778 family)